jgi:hypothetical protein
MTENNHQTVRTRRSRGGSLVIPILLITLGVLFLLDNLGIAGGIDWGTIWKLWPVLIIALGLEILLGRRVSCGGIMLIVIIFIVGASLAWWSFVPGSGERTIEQFSWPAEGIERAEANFNIGVGQLYISSQSDMADLLRADLELGRDIRVDHDLEVDGDVARGWIDTRERSFFLPQIFGGSANDWELLLNQRVRWELGFNSGVGDVEIDLTDLRVTDLRVDAGIGTTEVTMPRRGTIQARVDGGIGDVRIDIPEGMAARISVDRGISGLDIASRFQKRGDYYETSNYDQAESYLNLEIDVGIGNVTIR